jgi:hypothetical protein
MATNLIPIQLDKNTGRLIASTEGFSEGRSGFDGVVGYVHQQPVPSTIWYVEHNGQTDNILTQIYEMDGTQIFPDDIEVLNDNSVQISFLTPQTGKATIVLFATD